MRKMTRNVLVVAVVIVVAVAAVQFRSNLPPWHRFFPTVPSNEASATVPDTESDPDGIAVVELSAAEQESIGIQVTDVRRQTIVKKIQTIGRVETDLSNVWVQADVFEWDVSLIRIGQTAIITSPALQGEPLHGIVSVIKPSVDSETRTVAVRIQIENPQARLRPGMYVQVSFETPLISDGPVPLAVPRSAVLDRGKEKVVYVAKQNGIFEKRPIEAAFRGDEFYSVTKGLAAGERVVTQGNFLLDSQTRLTGNITGMFGGSKAFGTEGEARSSITFKVDPSQPKGGAENTFHVTVSDLDGKPVSDAQVQVKLVMPAMPSMGMGEMRSSYNLTWNGSEYTGTGTISMAGPWTVSVDARRGNQMVGFYKSHIDAK